MANTVTVDSPFVHISAMDGDFDWSLTDTGGLGAGLSAKDPIAFIHFMPNATNDILIVRSNSITGPIIMKVKAADAYDSKIMYFYGAVFAPCIDYSECVVASCLISICLWST